MTAILLLPAAFLHQSLRSQATTPPRLHIHIVNQSLHPRTSNKSVSDRLPKMAHSPAPALLPSRHSARNFLSSEISQHSSVRRPQPLNPQKAHPSAINTALNTAAPASSFFARRTGPPPHKPPALSPTGEPINFTDSRPSRDWPPKAEPRANALALPARTSANARRPVPYFRLT